MRPILYKLLAITLILIGLTSFIAMMYIGGLIPGAVLGGVAGLSGFCGSSLYRRAKQYQARQRLETARSDPRPPVLYLRAFDDDKKMAEFFGTENTPILPLQLVTEEERLARAFDGIGPFRALGASGEDLPTLGAERLYVEDAQWRERVRALVGSARLIVIRAAVTESLIWEMRLVMDMLSPERIVLLVPNDETVYSNFRDAFRKQFEIELPLFQPQENKAIKALHTGVIFFGPDWTPQFVPLHSRAFLRSTGYAPYFYALAPLYDRLGVPRTSPPVNWVIVGLLAVLAFFFIVLPLSIYLEKAFF